MTNTSPHQVLKNWSCKIRLKRSSPLLFDKKIREKIDLWTKTLKIINETLFFKPMPGNATITLGLIEHCTKWDSKIKQKELGTETISSLSSLNHINAYTNRSFDLTFTNDDAVSLVTPRWRKT